MNGGRKSRRSAAWTAPAAAGVFVLLWAAYSLMHLSPFAATWDEVDFALALDRFDLLAMQPHFPGYPYFVLAGMAMRTVVRDPVAAYGTVNVLLAASSALPIGLLARRMLSPAWSALAVVLALSSPYLWLQAVRPMSETAGIALLWWFLWSWQRAMERPQSWLRAAAALFAFGLLMGIRLSYAPFGLALVWLLAVMSGRWRSRGRRVLPRLLACLALAALFQLLWVAGLAASEGGPAGFLKLAAAFTAGHFTDWGGGATAPSAMPFAERLLRFAGGNLLWTGMFARSYPLLAAAAALLLTAIVRAGSEAPPPAGASAPPVALALAVPAGAYAVWALLAQNIDKPRHITPLIGLLWLLLLFAFRSRAPLGDGERPAESPEAEAASSAAAPSTADSADPPAPPPTLPISPGRPASRVRRQLQIAGAALAVIVAVLQSVQGGMLVARQAADRPAVVQLGDALADMQAARGAASPPMIVYTWEETRVLDYMRTPVASRRIETYNYFLADVKANPNAVILLTDHVLAGFEAQVGPLGGKVRKLASFAGDPLFDPVYANITLYEWVG